MTAQRFRLAAYAVCLREDRVLLARYVSQDGAQRHWTLPGGGVEHGEDPYHALVREVAEETGYQIVVERLLGVDSRTYRVDWGIPGCRTSRLRLRFAVIRPSTPGATPPSDGARR